jgi:hypothetical protein
MTAAVEALQPVSNLITFRTRDRREIIGQHQRIVEFLAPHRRTESLPLSWSKVDISLTTTPRPQPLVSRERSPNDIRCWLFGVEPFLMHARPLLGQRLPPSAQASSTIWSAAPSGPRPCSTMADLLDR